MLLKADQPSDKSYWISVGSQYRKGAPSAYGVLKYSTAGSSSPNPANIVTPGAVADKKWKTEGGWVVIGGTGLWEWGVRGVWAVCGERVWGHMQLWYVRTTVLQAAAAPPLPISSLLEQ